MLAVQARALKKVLVTGAGGRTGKLVFEQLKADDNYKPVGLARSSKAQKALKAVGASDDKFASRTSPTKSRWRLP